MINGEIVFENGKLTKVNEDNINREGERVFTNVLRSKNDDFSPYKKRF